MQPSQTLAIAAHLHVLLRRKTGRVTDTEWMAVNLEYAQEIVRFARAKAIEDGHADLAEWADKLERAAMQPAPAARTPLVQTAARALRERVTAAPPQAAVPSAPTEDARVGMDSSGFAHSQQSFGDSSLDPQRRKPRDPDQPRYVGGIR